MSGCCGQGPVIVSPAAGQTPRVDVEPLLLCDVLPDGTIAGVAAVEAVYDTTSGARVGTRIVNPSTGADYITQGTLSQCAGEPAGTDVETWPLCLLNTDGSVMQHVRAEQRYDAQGVALGIPRLVDAVTGLPVAIPGGATIGVCPDGQPCASPTTPVTSVGLCLADGTPIAVTVVRDCDGTTVSEGWINLVTGAYSAGAPPAGTVACGDSRSITTNGTFCDVDTDGNVLGLVLVEYQYAADGSIDTVRLVDAVTGTTYTPLGTITTCPAGVEQPEQDVVLLCDMQPDGTSVPMVRDYRRDDVGAIVGHSDYRLDGTQYQPTGEVGVCVEPCRTVQTRTLCDSAPQPVDDVTATNTEPTQLHVQTGVTWDTPVDGTPFFNGGSVVLPASASPGGATGTFRATAATLGIPEPCCTTGTVTITVSARITNDGPTAGQGSTGAVFLYNGSAQVTNQSVSPNFGVNGSEVRTLGPVDVPLADLLAGNIVYAVGLETNQGGATHNWTLSEFQTTAVLNGGPGCGTRFERVTVVDCATGETVTTSDRTLDGQPYTPVGEVADCAECLPPADTCTKQVIERCGCSDEDGDGHGEVQYTELWAVDPCGDDPPTLLGTYRDGDLTQPFTPAAPVDCTTVEALPSPLSTGVRRITGTAPQDLAVAFPGLQSVSLTVLAGDVQVTMSDGSAVPIPAGASLTWSVAQDTDTALTAAAFTGASAAASYLLNWTYR